MKPMQMVISVRQTKYFTINFIFVIVLNDCLALRLQLYYELYLYDLYFLLLIYQYIICFFGLLIYMELNNKNNNIFVWWFIWLNLQIIFWHSLKVFQMLKLWNQKLRDKEINMYLFGLKCLFLEVVLVELILLWRKLSNIHDLVYKVYFLQFMIGFRYIYFFIQIDISLIKRKKLFL